MKDLWNYELTASTKIMTITYAKGANFPHWFLDLISLFHTAPSHSFCQKKKKKTLHKKKIKNLHLLTPLTWSQTLTGKLLRKVCKLSKLERDYRVQTSDTRILSLVSLTKRHSTRFCLKVFKEIMKTDIYMVLCR